MSVTLLKKTDTLGQVSGKGSASAFEQYCRFFIGRKSLGALLRYELAQWLAVPCPGALGYLLRKRLLPGLFQRCEAGVQWGRNVVLRCPGRMSIGEGTAIDDYCLLDARSLEQGPFRLGRRVLVARNCTLQSKSDRGSIDIGDGSVISANSSLHAIGGIRFGQNVGLGPHCFVGGGLYKFDDPDTPPIKQQFYSTGPITVQDNVWIGAGVLILEGVTIGTGSIIAAGSVIREDVPPYTIVTPHQRQVLMKRPNLPKEEPTTPQAATRAAEEPTRRSA